MTGKIVIQIFQNIFVKFIKAPRMLYVQVPGCMVLGTYIMNDNQHMLFLEYNVNFG